MSPSRNRPSCQLLPAGTGWFQSGSLSTCSICSYCVCIVKTHRLVHWWAVNKKNPTNTSSYLKGEQSTACFTSTRRDPLVLQGKGFAMTAAHTCVGISLCKLKNGLKMLEEDKISNIIPRSGHCVSWSQPAKRNPGLKHAALCVQYKPAVTSSDVCP